MNLYQEIRYGLSLIPGPKNPHKCHHCGVGKRGVYTHYVDQITGVIVGPHVGFCDWKTCEKHTPYTPTAFFKSRGIYTGCYHKLVLDQASGTLKRQLTKCSMISPYKADLTLGHYHENNFVGWLHDLFDEAMTLHLIERFCIGTAYLWPGAAVFWQIDRQGYVRTGKIRLYNPTDGDLLIEQWAHNILKRGPELWEQNLDYILHQCLFGEHQLSWEPKTKPVALVESEVTAIIASGYRPDYIWMAVGDSDNLSVEMLQCLTGREVMLFPGSEAWNDWTLKIVQIHPRVSCHLDISNQLETIISEVNLGEMNA